MGLLAWDLHRRRWQALGCALAALAVTLAAPTSWVALLVDVLLVTLLALLLPQDRPRSPVGLPLPPLLRLAGPLLLVTLYLGLRLLPLGRAGGHAATDEALASAASLLAWAGLLICAGELLLRKLGPGFAALGPIGLLAGVLLTAPVSLGPLFPLAIRPALVLCPLIAAGRARHIEVIHQPLVYDLSPLDSLEFHYPPWYLHLLVCTVLAAMCSLAARRLQEHRR